MNKLNILQMDYLAINIDKKMSDIKMIWYHTDDFQLSFINADQFAILQNGL